jgi:hypothetical protein
MTKNDEKTMKSDKKLLVSLAPFRGILLARYFWLKILNKNSFENVGKQWKIDKKGYPPPPNCQFVQGLA